MIVPVSRANLRDLVESFGPIVEPVAPRPPIRGLGGQRLRLTQDRPGTATAATASLLAPFSASERWRNWNLDSRTLDRISAPDLIELLADVSPDVSRALWDFLRICNPGYEATVVRPSGALAPQSAQLALKSVLKTVGARHGDITVAIGKRFTSAFLRGGFLAEIVLDAAGRNALTLAIPDPASLRWKRLIDPEIGEYDQVGQLQGGRWVSLDRPTVRYLPIDPLPGKSEGRALAHPALFPTTFALALMQDTRRVIQQQGWPRLDLVVMLEKLQGAMPDDVEPGSEAYQAWLQEVIDEVSGYYASLEPDDAYVHTDAVEVRRPVGAADASSLGAIPKIVEFLERQAVRALKTMPLMMGLTDGVSEANANRQVDLYMMSIRSLQHLCENLLEHLLTLAIQAQGVPGVVRFRFAEAQGLQRQRNAQVQAVESASAWHAYQYGWISHAEAARRGAGVTMPDQDAPRVPLTTAAPTQPETPQEAAS